jgi:hypothetical protein
LRLGDLAEQFAHLFEIEDGPPVPFGAGCGEKLEMGSGDFNPRLSGERRTYGAEQEHGERNFLSAFHSSEKVAYQAEALKES